MMTVIGVPTYERLLEAWGGQFAPRADLEALGRMLCRQLGIREPEVKFSRRMNVRHSGRYRCGSILNYNLLMEDGQEWWSVETHLHELAHHVDHAFAVGVDRVPAHVRGFWGQLNNAAELAGRDYYVGKHQPSAHGPRFYVACQMVHRLAQRYLDQLKKEGK